MEYDDYNYNEDIELIKQNRYKKYYILGLISIIIVVIMCFTLSFFLIEKVKKIETDQQVMVDVGEEQVVRAKIDIQGDFEPFVIFNSDSQKYEINQKNQIGTEVETTIEGITAGRETLTITANKIGSKKKITKNINVLVCNKLKINNTGDNVLTLYVNTKEELYFNIEGECLESYDFILPETDIAEFDEETKIITAKKVGTAELMIYNQTSKMIYKIRVLKEPIRVKSLTLNYDSISLKIGDTRQIIPDIQPVDATNRRLIYVSSDEKIIKVDNFGKIMATGVGTGVIKATSSDNKNIYSLIYVTVIKKVVEDPVLVENVPVTDVAFLEKTYKVDQLLNVEMKVGMNPSNASNKAIRCKSLNTKIAVVTASGNNCIARGITPGETVIEVYTSNNKKATTKLIVEQPIKTINIRVGSWNIGRAAKHGGITANLLGSKIKEVNLDIVGMQEAKRSNGQKLDWTKAIGAVAGLQYANYVDTPAGNSVLSKFNIISSGEVLLARCSELRKLQKIVININDVDVAVYNTHLSYQSGCPAKQMVTVASILNSEVKPYIFVGDLNTIKRDIVLGPLKDAEIASNTGVDFVIISGKGKLKTVKAESYYTKDKYTDHNMAVAIIAVSN